MRALPSITAIRGAFSSGEFAIELLVGGRGEFHAGCRSPWPDAAPALPAKHHQLLFERLQAGEAGAHPGELGVDELVDLAALRARVLDEFQQAGDIGQRNVQGAAMADEAQSLEMSLCVAAIAVVRTRRRRKQADPLVVADGFDVHQVAFANSPIFIAGFVIDAIPAAPA